MREPGVGFQQLVTLRFYNPRIPMALFSVSGVHGEKGTGPVKFVRPSWGFRDFHLLA